MNRRGFLQAILAASVAPAFVRSGSLMRMVSPVITIPRSVGAIWAVNELGGFYASFKLSEELRKSVQKEIVWQTYGKVSQMRLS